MTKARADVKAGTKAAEKALKAATTAQEELVAADAALKKLAVEAQVRALL